MKKFLCVMLALMLLAGFALAEGLLNEFDMVARIKSQPGLYLVQKEGLWGVADGDGSMVLDAQFEEVGAFEEGVATVCKDGKWGLISDTGEIVYEPELRSEPKFVNGFAVAVMEDRSKPSDDFSGVEGEYASSYGVIDRSGKIIVPVEYESLEIDAAGETILAAIPDKNEYSNVLYGYMNLQGEWIVEPKYARANPMIDGHAAVAVRNDLLAENDYSNPYYVMWGVIDSTGKTLVPFQYSWIDSGMGDLVIVSGKDGSYGYMNLEGEWIIQPKFNYAELFQDGTAIVSKLVGEGDDSGSGETSVYAYGVIDETGAEILPFEYDYIQRKVDGTFSATRTSKEEKTRFRFEDGKAVPVE